ncbi:MAG: hypothetical protein ACI8T1_003834 [Verrucomicrobiales bacterium]|jgi:hypothetical protein
MKVTVGFEINREHLEGAHGELKEVLFGRGIASFEALLFAQAQRRLQDGEAFEEKVRVQLKGRPLHGRRRRSCNRRVDSQVTLLMALAFHHLPLASFEELLSSPRHLGKNGIFRLPIIEIETVFRRRWWRGCHLEESER